MPSTSDGKRKRGRLAKWARRIVVALLVVTAAATGYVWWWLRASLPVTSGVVKLRGISGPVTIARDARGIPTISATSDDDALFGLGYVHAQDRFFQMEMQRRAGQGRMSELAGPGAVEADTFLRRLGLYRSAEAAESSLEPATRAALVAYSAGVNGWLEAHRDALPPELGLLRLTGRRDRPEPWRPADSAVWAKLMALSLSGNFREELMRADVVEKVGAERAATLFPEYPRDAPVIVGAATGATGAIEERQRRAAGSGEDDGTRALFRALAATLGLGSDGLGSNAWAIAPARSASGHPLLANDPHLGVQSPSTWYIARIESPGLRVEGMTLPGLPAVIIGRNDRIAWGITNLASDTQDLFLERVDPKDPARYLNAGGSAPFVARSEQIAVAGRAQPITIAVRETAHGPIIRDDWKGRGPLALRWTALDRDDTTLDAFLGVQRAGNWAELRRALARLVAPSLSVIYADVDGHIGYQATGRAPIRGRGQGLVPLDGWEAGNDWSGVVAFDDLPRAYDPAEGFIVSANNRPAGDGYRYFLGASFSDGLRARRIRELIAERAHVAPDDQPAMQADRKSGLARELLPVLLGLTPSDRPRRAAAIALLGGWDFVAAPESAAGAVFVAWYAHLVTELLGDELGDKLLADYGDSRGPAVRAALTAAGPELCDDRRTPERESCSAIATRALDRALDDLAARLGPDPARWRLDRLLAARFANRVGSRTPLLGGLFTRVVPVGGDPSTVRVTHLALDGSYEVTALPSCLVDIALGPGGSARYTLPLGESGHPLSPHFDDQLASWRLGDPAPLGAPGAGGSLTLVPSVE